MSGPVRLALFAAVATMASALSLESVFASSAWVIPVMGAIVIVTGVSALIRWSPLPSALEPLSAAAAVLVWLTGLYAGKQAYFGFVPGRASLRRLGHLARNGFTDVHKLPTPVPANHGLVLLAVVGVAAIALIVDLLTVTLRRAALAGLPLLALFVLSAATGRHGVSVVDFIVGAIGYLWLLYVDNRERVTRWGAAVGTGSRARPASAWASDPTFAPAPAALGRRVGAVAIGVGVIIPLLIPGLHTGIDRHTKPGNGNGSGGNVHTFDPIVSVAQDLGTQVIHPVLTYTTTSPDPGYLRLTSLDTYSNGAFSGGSLRQPASAAVSNGLRVTPTSTTTVTTHVQVDRGYDFRWLPAPTRALKVTVPGDWLYDPGTSTIFSATDTTSGLSYTVDSSPDQPSPAQLSQASSGVVGPMAQDLETPGVSQQVKDLTSQVIANAATTYDAALDIEHFLDSGRFTYSTTVSPTTSTDALTNFLLHTRKGFCQQFATSMAVMARLSGIPSRVAVGFTEGSHQPDGSYLVTTHDAHAWPELWFKGYGWLAFEPTPRHDGQAQTPSYALPRANHHAGSADGHPLTRPTQQPGNTKQKQTSKAKTSKLLSDGGGAAGGAGGGSDSLPIALAILIVVVVAAAIPGAARVAVRRRRWRMLHQPGGGADAAWAELRDSAIDVGAPWDDGVTPRATARMLLHWAGDGSNVRAPLIRLTSAEEQGRYAASPPTGNGDLQSDTEQIRRALLSPRSAVGRLTIAVLPRSVLLRLRRRVSGLADLGDRLQRLPEQLGRRLAAAVRPIAPEPRR